MDPDDFGDFGEYEVAIPVAYAVTPSTVLANVFGLGRDLFTSFAKFMDACQDDCLAAHNNAALKRQFHEQAALEIESITATPED